MLFIIQLASSFETKPSKESFRTTIPIWDYRTFKTPEEFNKIREKAEGDWFSKGSEHQINTNGIARKLGSQTVWGIEIGSIDDIIRLQEEVGDIIIQDFYGIEDINLKKILVYDDYIE